VTTNDALEEHPTTNHQPYEYVIVGGGIHGACLTSYLLTEGEYTHDEIRILDPREELLTSFAKKARQCGMETLRSTFVHHIGIEPFSLESFAEEAGREGELVSTESYPDRPTLDLFPDHARDIADHRDFDDCHHRSRVTDVTRSTSQEGYLLETDRRHRVRGVRFGRARGAQRRPIRSEHRRCSTRRGTNPRSPRSSAGRPTLDEFPG